MNSKKKGSGGERELLELLHRYGIQAERNDQRYLSGEGLPDILARISGKEIHVEAKRCEKLKLTEWIAQANYDVSFTPHRIPIVIFRRNRQPWYCTISFENFMKLLNIEKKEDESHETDTAGKRTAATGSGRR